MSGPDLPLHVFRFKVLFQASAQPGSGQDANDRTSEGGGDEASLAHGAFSEVTGLEATMEPFAVTEGGRNRGQAQFVGRTGFSTVILKRGFTTTRHLWDWFDHVNKAAGAYANRMDVTIVLHDPAGNALIQWTLRRALPVKIKLPDLNAAGAEVGVEELHLAFEDLEESRPGSEGTPMAGEPTLDASNIA